MHPSTHSLTVAVRGHRPRWVVLDLRACGRDMRKGALAGLALPTSDADVRLLVRACSCASKRASPNRMCRAARAG
jgi:hypothetical protein